MKDTKKLGLLGRIIMIIGALMYAAELIWFDSWAYNLALTGIFAVAIVLMAIDWRATREERRERRAQERKQRTA